MYVRAVPPIDLNRNTEWFTYPGIWTTDIIILFTCWLIVLSLSGCSSGTAWTVVNLCHCCVTYQFFHWKKGTPFGEDQGIYCRLTWWEQIENGKQLTRNRKFLTVVPVVLYLIASRATDYEHRMLFFNTLAVFVLVVAKFPHMHKVRIFGVLVGNGIPMILIILEPFLRKFSLGPRNEKLLNEFNYSIRESYRQDKLLNPRCS